MKDAAALIEVLDEHDRSLHRQRFALVAGAPLRLRVGRSVSADICVDDPYVAAEHAEIEIHPDGRVVVTDAGSVNGVMIGGLRLFGATGVAVPDGLVGVGRCRLRVRTSLERLPAEKPDSAIGGTWYRDPRRLALISGVAMAGIAVYESWAGAPRELAMSIATMLAGVAALVACWVAFWGLLSRIMTGGWRWLPHAAILLTVMLVWQIADTLLDLGAFMLDLGSSKIAAGVLAVALAGLLLFLHLINASSLSRRRAASITTAFVVLVGGFGTWMTSYYAARNVAQLPSTPGIYHPALRVRPPGGLGPLMAAAKSLRERADIRREAVKSDVEDD